MGLKTERGFVKVDAQMRTEAKGVWAIGDLVPTLALAHVASHEGIVAADDIAGKGPAPVRYDRCPSATYSTPEAASVGLTEKRAREQGREVKVGSFPFSAVGKATILGESDGFVKIVSDAQSDELIAEACAALQLETTTEELTHTVHAHPTLAEAVGEAAHAVLGKTLNL